ncbi:MAG: hypothetical protein R3208_14205 [Ketobacteraceae bacterium]|nr:hypothetical protein [Ketobacteraceae bacterium]
MNLSELVNLPGEDSDIEVFTAADDLFSPDSHIRDFDQRKFNDQIEFSAHRARLVVEAQAQMMLARYRAETPDQQVSYHEKAEAMAYELGRSEFNGLETPVNPFEDPALAAAWDNGYSYSAHLGKPQAQINLEKQFWEQGVDPESVTSQFELAAIALYNLSRRTADARISDRCRRLACEMMAYDRDNPPTDKRQREINTFMARQSERIAQAIDEDKFF